MGEGGGVFRIMPLWWGAWQSRGCLMVRRARFVRRGPRRFTGRPLHEGLTKVWCCGGIRAAGVGRGYYWLVRSRARGVLQEFSGWSYMSSSRCTLSTN
jgi:hypothetical protein